MAEKGRLQGDVFHCHSTDRDPDEAGAACGVSLDRPSSIGSSTGLEGEKSPYYVVTSPEGAGGGRGDCRQ